MTKNKIKPSTKLRLTKQDSIEGLVRGDIVSLHLHLFMRPWPDQCHAVYESFENHRYSFLDLDRRINNGEILRITAHRKDMNVLGAIKLYSFQEEYVILNELTKEEKRETIRLLNSGIHLLKRAYTFDEVYTVDRNNKIIKIEKNKSLI